jgi:hypothetical protein
MAGNLGRGCKSPLLYAINDDRHTVVRFWVGIKIEPSICSLERLHLTGSGLSQFCKPATQYQRKRRCL